MMAAGRPFGVVLADRPPASPLSDAEKHTLWTLGKIAALATAARVSTREQERARELEERIDLAREVHDRVIQRLFGVSLALAGDGPLGAPERRRAGDELEAALADLRVAVRRPLGLRSEPTATTLHAEVARLAEAHPDLGVRMADGPPAAVPAHLEALAQSVLAEAIRNAHRHARPTEVVVTVVRGGDALRLDVVNDGVEPGRRRGLDGIGLRLAALEALHIGGTVEAGRLDAGTWRVRLVVPEAHG
jgi:signal transduction histidine kinase